jgi:hypothetical protein
MTNSKPTRGGLFRHLHRKPRPTANDLALAKLSNALIRANLIVHRHLDPELWIIDGEADDLALLCEVDEILGVALLDLFDDDAEDADFPRPGGSDAAGRLS